MEILKVIVPSVIDPYYAQIEYIPTSNKYRVYYPSSISTHKTLDDLLNCLRANVHIKPEEVDKVEDQLLEYLLLGD